jgi:hypothetical protein
MASLDLPAAPAGDAPPGIGEPRPAALSSRTSAAAVDPGPQPTDHTAMDAIALLFDYIFRDPSILAPGGWLWQRAPQVLDRRGGAARPLILPDRRHSARALLDHR